MKKYLTLLSYLDNALPGIWWIRIQNYLSFTGVLSPIPPEVLTLRIYINKAKKDHKDRKFLDYFDTFIEIIRPYLNLEGGMEELTGPINKENWADYPPAKQLAYWEYYGNLGNNPAKRRKIAEGLIYFLIPEEHLTKLSPAPIDPKIIDFFKIIIEGKTYYKFPINNEDTKYVKKIRTYLRKLKLDDRLHVDPIGQAYKTASRSSLVGLGNLNDPGTSVISVKTSTNRTGGNWTDKGMNGAKAERAMQATSLLNHIKQSKPFNFLILLTEPLAFIIGPPKKRLSVVFRDYAEVFDKNNYLMPVFSILHENHGREIAQLNGSGDPAEYWKNNLIIPLAKAQAELAAHTSLTIESAHSQQYLVELDKAGKPTGKIAIRDFDGSYALMKFFSEPTQFNTKFFNDRNKYGKMRKALEIRFGLFHGTPLPSWLETRDINEWLDTFFNTFESHLMELTGLTRDDLPIKANPHTTSFLGIQNMGPAYFSKTYPTNSSGWENWFNQSGIKEELNEIPGSGK